MPSDLTVTRLSAPAAPPVSGQAALGPAVAGERPVAIAPGRARADLPAAPATPFPNPTLRLDAALSMVVIEFRDDSGGVRTSIPTAQQLAAYRSWDRSRVGEPPRGMPGAGEAPAEPAPAPAPVGGQAAGARDAPLPAPLPAAPTAAPAPAEAPAPAAGTAG